MSKGPGSPLISYGKNHLILRNSQTVMFVLIEMLLYILLNQIDSII